jgi:hypothetical protein
MKSAVALLLLAACAEDAPPPSRPTEVGEPGPVVVDASAPLRTHAARLPVVSGSVAWTPPPGTVLVEVGPDAVRVDGLVMAPMEAGQVVAEARKGLRIERLHAALKERAPDAPVLLAIDAGVPVGVMRSVTFTLLVSGVSSVRVWVADPAPGEAGPLPDAPVELVVERQTDGVLRAGPLGGNIDPVPTVAAASGGPWACGRLEVDGDLAWAAAADTAAAMVAGGARYLLVESGTQLGRPAPVEGAAPGDGTAGGVSVLPVRIPPLATDGGPRPDCAEGWP